ncbi:MAG: hypothetical protein RIG61_11220 [Deltaproteobacteria bacterium]
MKIMRLKIFSIIVLAAGLLITTSAFSRAQSVSDSPQALGDKMVAAIKAKNKNDLMSLIHPQVVKYMEANNPKKLDETLQNWVNTEVPPNHEFVVQSVKDIPDYDPAAQTLTFGQIKMYFPTPPTDFLVLVGDVEAKIQKDGKEEIKKGRGPVTIDAIAQNKGNWYVVLPVLQSAGENEQKQ